MSLRKLGIPDILQMNQMRKLLICNAAGTVLQFSMQQGFYLIMCDDHDRVKLRATQQRLAACITNILVRPSLRRPDDSRSCRLAARYRKLLSPRLRLRVESRQFGNPWSLLSSWYRPISSPPSNKRLCVPFPGACQNPIPQGANRAFSK